jgi:hypothetical protein
MRWLGRLLPWLSRRVAFSQLEGKRRGAGRAGLPNRHTNLPPGPAERRLNKRLPRGCVAYHGAGACQDRFLYLWTFRGYPQPAGNA